MAWLKRRLYVCEHYSCGLRTRDFYRASMHKTMTGHRPRRELENAPDYPRGFLMLALAAALLGIVMGFWR